MKKVIVMLLSIILVMPSLSLSSRGAGKKVSYTAGVGASYMLDVNGKIDKSYCKFSDGREARVGRIGDEDFIIIDKPYITDKKNNKPVNNSTLEFSIDAANATYKSINPNYNGMGVPEAIHINSDVKTTFLGFRIKINDNSAAFSKSTSTMRIVLNSKYNKSAELTSSYGGTFYWLDLNDGSMTWAFTQSGYMPINKRRNANNRTSGIEFTGSMDGYIFIPMTCVLGNETSIVTTKFLRNYFESIVFKFRTGSTDIDGNEAKFSSWENKEILLGDVVLVNKIDDFAQSVSSKRKMPGKMYSFLVDDTAFYARRVGGYRSMDQVRVGDAFGKMPFDPEDNVPDMQSNRQFVHITTLPNGDRAQELVLNTKDNSNVVDSSGKPYTGGAAMLSMYDTYDFSKVSESQVPSKHGVRTKGVPSEIDLDAMKYLAFRIATRDGSIKNQEVEFSVRLAPAISNDASVFRTTTYYLTAGEVTYLDLESLKTKTLSVAPNGKDGLISYKGNLDGYIIVPIDRFNTKLDSSGTVLNSKTIRECWGAYYNYAYQGIYYVMQSGFENGKAFYAGDIFFVGNEEEFVNVRTTDCKAVGHKVEVVPAVPATCTKEGVSQGKKCSVCDEDISGFEVIEKLEHDYKFSKRVEPSKNANGYEIYKCHLCNATLRKEYGEKIEQTSSSTFSDIQSTPEQSQASDVTSDKKEQNPQTNENNKPRKDVTNSAIIIIVVAAAILLVSGTVITVLLVRKKKK